MSKEAILKIVDMILSKESEIKELGISTLILSRTHRQISKSQFKSILKSIKDRKIRLSIKHKIGKL